MLPKGSPAIKPLKSPLFALATSILKLLIQTPPPLPAPAPEYELAPAL